MNFGRRTGRHRHSSKQGARRDLKLLDHIAMPSDHVCANLQAPTAPTGCCASAGLGPGVSQNNEVPLNAIGARVCKEVWRGFN